MKENSVKKVDPL